MTPRPVHSVANTWTTRCAPACLFCVVLLLSWSALPRVGSADEPVLSDADRRAMLEEAQRLFQKGTALYREQRLEEAIQVTERIIALREKALGHDHPNVTPDLRNLALLYTNLERHREAAALYERTLGIMEKQAGADDDVATILNDLATSYQTQARFPEAERLFKRALAIREAMPGADKEVALVLNNLGLLYLLQSRGDEAEAFLLRALAIKERVFGPDHLNVTATLNNLALLYASQGRFDEAEPLYLRSLAIVTKVLGEGDASVARLMNNLAEFYQARARYDEAESYYQRALDSMSAAKGAEHLDVVTIRCNLAELYRKRDRFDEAESIFLDALRLREAKLGVEHPDVATSLNNLAVLYQERGDLSKAELYFVRALRVTENTLGSEHKDVAQSLNSLADLYVMQGRFDKAEPLYQRAIAIRQKILNPEHPDVATSMTSLGILYHHQGLYAEAEPLLAQALQIRETVFGPKAPEVAVSLSNLATLYLEQNRHADAEQLAEIAVDMMVETRGEQHPDVARLLGNLAGLYDAQGRHKEQEAALLRALAIQQKILPVGHPHLAVSMNNLASLYSSQERYKEAESLYQRALTIWESSLGREHPQVGLVLSNLAFMYDGLGRYADAEKRHRRSLDIWEHTLGPDHPYVARGLNKLTAHFLATGDTERALASAERAERILDVHLASMMTWGHEEQRRRFMARTEFQAHIGMTLVLRMPERASELGLRYMLRNKSRVLDGMRSTLATIRKNLDDEGRALLGRYLDINTQYTTLYLSGPKDTTSEERARHDKELVRLLAAKRDIEAELSARNRRFSDARTSVSLEEVERALPKGSALVEWIRYRPYGSRPRDLESTEAWDPWQSPPRYAACVLSYGARPWCLDLDDAETIDNAAVAFQRALAKGVDASEQGAQLHKLIMAPIRPHLGAARTIYLSPDGALHFVPIAALVTARDGVGHAGHYLVEDYELTYVSSGRDIARKSLRDARDTSADTAPGRDPITIIGGPRYDLPGHTSSGGFTQLYGALLEARDIHAMLPETARLYTFMEATKSVLQSVHAPSILHLATHAHFEGRDCHGNVWESGNPLLSAGLALAGANACEPEESQGIMTGEDIAALDLHGTELVVLSACDTGLGELELRDDISRQPEYVVQRINNISEGVYGLRRALALAGAETQVTSLWKVDDAVTRELMVAYYQALLTGAGRSEALRQVQLAMLRDDKRSHPNHWASFVVVGEDAPLRHLPVRDQRSSREPRGPRGCGGCQATVPDSQALAGAALVLALALFRRRRS